MVIIARVQVEDPGLLSGGRQKFQPQVQRSKCPWGKYIEYFEDWNLSPAVGGMCHLTQKSGR